MKHLSSLALSLFFFATACTNTVALAPLQYGGPGQVIAHQLASRRIYIGSPAIAVLPNGDYLASNDFFGPNSEARVDGLPITRIYKSVDRGQTWSIQTDLIGQFMSNLFVHKDDVYVLGVHKSAGNVVIRKSIDQGQTWTTPADAGTGLLRVGRYHTAPTPVVEHNGRLWRAIEDQEGFDKITWPKMFQAMMLSAPVDSNLLDANSWTLSNAMPYDSTYLNGYFYGWLEGNAVVGPDQTMWNMLRVHTFDKVNERVAMIKIGADGTTAQFDAKTGFIRFPGGGKKFTIRYDSKSNKYWTLANHVPEADRGVVSLDKVRNTLALCSSTDLINWTINETVLYHEDKEFHGFQYVDWQFDGEDIVAVSRTAHDDGFGGANSYHNNNFMTFHRVENFRSK
jgi:hypothetical protein